ncbi:MAG: phosphate regulon transcriptional regulator PhoB [Gammaproteobacteria bacterium]|jgi:two-component system, OmpR family, phosphate regulon response regulator PhoB|nr:phosphate regulon transcriptional regulator PhoB [Gammaproteobacteria bacterium]MBT6755313.1 phosphate regulon transcriptional regulator PhoB [Gammaproteobacteria bacterium]MBT7523616.1 phosphate regulon transcriptional regulator PhoB [Gammaproteobacteria bacterium]MBT7814188.1 phosphate regulon transcriptional regulator PhoB [Gammaproteobacteria bacterium]
MAAKILIIEDEIAVREMLTFTLKNNGFETFEAGNSEEALNIVSKNNINLILLDWMLPGKAGIDIARSLRASIETKELPIIMLTAKSEESDKIMGLESGADDYITKPFSPKELMARIKALLRRSAPQTDMEVVIFGSINLNPMTHKVKDGDKNIILGPTEFNLLHFFMTHPERVYSRAQLLDFVWGTNVYVEERTVDVHILRLRKSLESETSKYIQTVRGAGYRLSK